MAGRTRAALAAARAQVPGLLDLPEDCTFRILRLLAFPERRRVAPVCKRLCSLVNDATLLQDVLPIRASSMEMLQAFAAWAAARGGHMRRLELDTNDLKSLLSVPLTEASLAGYVHGIEQHLLAVFAAAAATLEQLQLTVFMQTTRWLVGLESLRSAELLAPGGVLHIPAELSSLAALNSLTLHARYFCFAHGSKLPVALTRLRLSGEERGAMAAQVAQLPQLAQLELSDCCYSADGLALLSSLADSLTRLDIRTGQQPDVPPAQVPPTLAALTGLHHLSLRGFSLQPEPAQQLDAALPELARLTCLVLTGAGLALPPAVGSLAQLQRCLVVRSDAPAAPPPLPPGPWLSRLRWLGANWGSLLRSSAVLRGAAALEFVAVHATEDDETNWEAGEANAFFDWLAQHPPLRRVLLNDSLSVKLPKILVEQLRRRRPVLLVEWPGTRGQSMMHTLVGSR